MDIKVLITEQEIASRTRELAEQIQKFLVAAFFGVGYCSNSFVYEPEKLVGF